MGEAYFKSGRDFDFIEWICLSGIASRVYRAEQIKRPLENYRNIAAFKIYVSDMGLLCAKKIYRQMMFFIWWRKLMILRAA